MNKCIFVGNISKLNDLVMGSTPYIKFSVAVNRKTKGEADFVNYTAFGKTAEFISKWVKVGNKVCIESHYQSGSYEKDGKKVYTHDFLVDNIENLTKAELNKGEEKAEFVDALEDEGLPFN